MEGKAWERDTTPYILFSCKKCHQYTYVKGTQHFKKCVRCGYTHKVSKVVHHGEIVNGISRAVELVKQKQNELAIKELGSEPEFRTSGDFVIAGKEIKQKKNLKLDSVDHDYSEIFEAMLYKLSESHKTFPFYIIEIMAEIYGIPQTEVKLLVRTFQKTGILKRLKDGQFRTILR